MVLLTVTTRKNIFSYDEATKVCVTYKEFDYNFQNILKCFLMIKCKAICIKFSYYRKDKVYHDNTDESYFK